MTDIKAVGVCERRAGTKSTSETTHEQLLFFFFTIYFYFLFLFSTGTVVERNRKHKKQRGEECHTAKISFQSFFFFFEGGSLKVF